MANGGELKLAVAACFAATAMLFAGAASAAPQKTAAHKPAPAVKPVAKSKAAAAAKKAKRAAPSAPEVSDAGHTLVEWIIGSADNRGLPFVVIDKIAAQVAVYDKAGKLIGLAPALLGAAYGDDSTPGVGDRELSDIAPEERTTPAGRYLAGFGPAYGGKKVLWVDYKTAISLHPVITAHPQERRPQRLASATPDDNRITYGCINVSAAFYKKVVLGTLKGKNGVVYILPELGPIESAFPAYRPDAALLTLQDPVPVAAAGGGS